MSLRRYLESLPPYGKRRHWTMVSRWCGCHYCEAKVKWAPRPYRRPSPGAVYRLRDE